MRREERRSIQSTGKLRVSATEFRQFQTITVSQCCLIQSLPHILFEKYIYILALEMASPGNQHCASCIGTLSFPIGKLCIRGGGSGLAVG